MHSLVIEIINNYLYLVLLFPFKSFKFTVIHMASRFFRREMKFALTEKWGESREVFMRYPKSCLKKAKKGQVVFENIMCNSNHPMQNPAQLQRTLAILIIQCAAV